MEQYFKPLISKYNLDFHLFSCDNGCASGGVLISIQYIYSKTPRFDDDEDDNALFDLRPEPIVG